MKQGLIRTRRPARYLYYRKRFLALSSKDKVRLKFYINRLSMIRACDSPLLPQKVRDQTFQLTYLMFLYILSIVIEPSYTLPGLEKKDINFRYFDQSNCWNFFETRQEDLPRLKRVLRIPDIIVLENRSTLSGKELLLRGLYELVSGADQNEIAYVFGRDQSHQSRVFSYFIVHIFTNFSDLVTDNLEWWYENGYLLKSMEAIKAKIDGSDNFNVFGFIDCNCLETSRPGGGPITGGEDAERWDPFIQKAFYNGWKSCHGLKHQTVDTAYGITIDLYGPTSLRRNDLRLLRDSRINARLRELQIGKEIQLIIYGDSIYPQLTHLKSSWKTPNPNQKDENKRFSKVRIPIEWNYSTTASLYSYLCRFDKLKILGTANTSIVYTVATILRNCHVCLYGSETSSYFDLDIEDDFLEKYMKFR